MFKVIGGDFPKETAFVTPLGKNPSLCWGWRESLPLNGNIEKVEMVTEENKKKFLASAGWGLVGGALLGPVGLVAGAIVGGNRKEICFAVYLKDGRKFLAVADSKTYQQIVAASMNMDSN